MMDSRDMSILLYIFRAIFCLGIISSPPSSRSGSCVCRLHKQASRWSRKLVSGDRSGTLLEGTRYRWDCSCSHPSRSWLGSHSSRSSRRGCCSTRPSAEACRSPESLADPRRIVPPRTKSKITKFVQIHLSDHD